MKWASVLVVMSAGCGAMPVEVVEQETGQVQTQPLTAFDAIMTACPNDPREGVLAAIESSVEGRLAGRTFTEAVDFLNDSDCGTSFPSCRSCTLAILEWVHFGVLP